ncbi:hypothetical protein EVAR_41982_1 [Eumeta japonica]|uniref:Uncharacterized protein n=1 Tax=Eumeta variegata TaxID=151549 RepID=A0A4C1WP40_EUMVA|nr:hypothetical protein EVAR_41982_1 [Eumeta japonica]
MTERDKSRYTDGSVIIGGSKRHRSRRTGDGRPSAARPPHISRGERRRRNYGRLTMAARRDTKIHFATEPSATPAPPATPLYGAVQPLLNE